MAKRKRRIRKNLQAGFKKETFYSILGIIFLLMAGLITFSFAGKGSLLIKLNQTLFSLFSWASFLTPFLFLSLGLMFSKINWRLAKPSVFIGSLLIFFSLLGLFHWGLIGWQIWLGLISLISAIGAVFVLVSSLVVGIIVLFETSLTEIFLFFSAAFKFFKKYAFSLWQSPTKDSSLIISKEPVKIRGLETKEQLEIKEEKPAKAAAGEGIIQSAVVANPKQVKIKEWIYPPLSLLNESLGGKADRGDLKENAAIIEKTLESFGIEARVVEVNCGPAVTQYALEIALGTKLSKVTALSNDLALALAAPTGQIRIEAPIPGRSLVGVEIPNRTLEYVTLRKMLSADILKKAKSKLTVSLGLDVSGRPVVADIVRMPHVLIAGATGSGKSVCINSFIASILFRATPEEVKFILVDPKRVELTQYNGIPHLLTPVIVEPEKVIAALKWAISEMERRYKLFAENSARNIENFNEICGFQKLPYIVIIIDELADIMLFSPSEVEDSITRIAQMARATGIHLIVSTQRPSVDVITGLIKANIPCRIAFNVSSMVDSRVIIDMPGAEKLLGRGDMLYIPPDQAKPTRIQGTYVSDKEIRELIRFLKETGVSPSYTEEITSKYQESGSFKSDFGDKGDFDEFFQEAVRIVCQFDRASASLLQRRLHIGYSRAARILDQLEAEGVVGPAEGAKPREVLIKDYESYLAEKSKT